MYQNIDFSKEGGFPLTQNKMAFIQNSYNKVFESITGVIGNYGIISGVVNDGSGNYNDGWVTYDGEIIPFVGGVISSGPYVGIVETRTSVTYRDSGLNDVIITRKAKFTNDNTKPNILSFRRLNLPSLKSDVDNALKVANTANSTANNALNAANAANLAIANLTTLVNDLKASTKLIFGTLPGYSNRQGIVSTQAYLESSGYVLWKQNPIGGYPMNVRVIVTGVLNASSDSGNDLWQVTLYNNFVEIATVTSASSAGGVYSGVRISPAHVVRGSFILLAGQFTTIEMKARILTGNAANADNNGYMDIIVLPTE